MKIIKKIIFFYLLLINIFSSLVFCSTLDGEESFVEELTQGNPKILYFSDTNHTNFRLKSVYTELVTKISSKGSDYNCIFLEADKEIFQPAIDDYMTRRKSWDQSVGLAQKKWEKLTGRNYKQAPELFLNRLRELELQVFAVDWSDNSLESHLMRNLFSEGFSGGMSSLKRAFYWGVEVRNSVMAQNMKELLFLPTDTLKPTCRQAIMFVGGLHLASRTDMPMGQENYTSIASHFDNGVKQSAHEILDCNDLGAVSSVENSTQCKNFNMEKITIPDLFNSRESFEISLTQSVSGTAGSQIRTSPRVIYNIMIAPRGIDGF